MMESQHTDTVLDGVVWKFGFVDNDTRFVFVQERKEMTQPDARGHIVIALCHDNLYNVMMHKSLVYDGSEDAYGHSDDIGEASVYVQQVATGWGYCVEAIEVQIITQLVDDGRVRFRG